MISIFHPDSPDGDKAEYLISRFFNTDNDIDFH